MAKSKPLPPSTALTRLKARCPLGPPYLVLVLDQESVEALTLGSVNSRVRDCFGVSRHVAVCTVVRQHIHRGGGGVKHEARLQGHDEGGDRPDRVRCCDRRWSTFTGNQFGSNDPEVLGYIPYEAKCFIHDNSPMYGSGI